MPILLAFILVPLIEIALFIQVGDAIGLWWTLGTVVVTAIVGASLVRRQGADILARLQRSLDDFRDPTTPLAEGAMVLFSGALLLTPGFFTDVIGFLLLVPGIRHVIIARVGARVKETARKKAAQRAQYDQRHDPRYAPHHDSVHRAGPGRPQSGARRPDEIIEGDYEIEPDARRDDVKHDGEKKGPSGWSRH